ncbi:hypothetical protein D3C77_597600 [compost metagenome]
MASFPGVLGRRPVGGRFGGGAQAEFGAGGAAERNQSGAAVAFDDFGIHIPFNMPIQHRPHGAGQAQGGRAQVFQQGGHTQEGPGVQLRQPLFRRQPGQFIVQRLGQAQPGVGFDAAGGVDGGIARRHPVHRLLHRGKRGGDALGDIGAQRRRVEG